MVRISVIIPVYNVEDYLEETLNSILNQSVADDVEVLMIDDGSTDDSRYIIEKYALDYDNFHAFHKKREGPGIARNYGLKRAKGEYIHFLDSDDYIPPNAYETFLSKIDNHDFIVGKTLRFTNYNLKEDLLFNNSLNRLKGKNVEISLQKYPCLIWDTAIWNKFYKKEFLLENNIHFPNKDILYEDLLFALKCYVHAKSVIYFDDIIYYWRFRGKKTSITQNMDTKSFFDRIEITNLSHELLAEHGFTREIMDEFYLKMLNHDFKIHLNKFHLYPEQYHEELINEVYDIIKTFPENLIDSLITYNKLLYRMIGNKDKDALIYISQKRNEINENPNLSLDIDDDYLKYVDFKNEGGLVELAVECDEITSDESNLFVKFSEKIEYISRDFEHEIAAKLMDDDENPSLNVKDNVISIPLDLLKDKKCLKIKVIYSCDNFTNESYLKNNSRKSISFKDFDIDIGIGIDSVMIIDCIMKNDNEIHIKDVALKDDSFEFKATSMDKVSEVFLKNVVTFEIKKYPVSYNGDEFSFSLPFKDIMNSPIKKWELNCQESINSISLDDSLLIYDLKNKIRISNARNKILISNSLCNPILEIYELNSKNNILKDEQKDLKNTNKRLKRENQNLTERNEDLKRRNKILRDLVDEYKSRKVVKIADKIKR